MPALLPEGDLNLGIFQKPKFEEPLPHTPKSSWVFPPLRGGGMQYDRQHCRGFANAALNAEASQS
jgi:hypothetical protein